MLLGKSAIDFLANEVCKIDSESSSHWHKYHSSFQFTGNGFKGLQGFGGNRKPRGLIPKIVERFLQLRFRKMDPRQDFLYLDDLAREIALKENRNYDLDLLRQVLTLAFLRKTIPNLKEGGLVGCVIGDGFASMSSLLLSSGSTSKVILVNLTKTLLVDLWYLRVWMGEERFEKTIKLVTNKEDLQLALGKPISFTQEINQVIAIRATDHQLIGDCPIDFAINIVSMQEMNPKTISAYFDDLRRSISERPLYFYCCNRQEKHLPDGTITKFIEYPWLTEDQILVDEITPWHQEYYSFTPPFYRKYDGPILHRLARMAKYN
jgi:hypothetical protein